jgi:hypothetical protein
MTGASIYTMAPIDALRLLEIRSSTPTWYTPGRGTVIWAGKITQAAVKFSPMRHHRAVKSPIFSTIARWNGDCFMKE